MMMDFELDMAMRDFQPWHVEPVAGNWPMGVAWLGLPKAEIGELIEVGQVKPLTEWHGAHKHGTAFFAKTWRPSALPPWVRVAP